VLSTFIVPCFSVRSLPSYRPARSERPRESAGKRRFGRHGRCPQL